MAEATEAVAVVAAAVAVVVVVRLGDGTGARDFVLEKISCGMRPKYLTGRRRGDNVGCVWRRAPIFQWRVHHRVSH